MSVLSYNNKNRVEPDTTRTVFGWLAVLSFVLGMYFCDLALTPGSPSWTANAVAWSLIAFFFFLLFWGLMRIQDDNI